MRRCFGSVLVFSTALLIGVAGNAVAAHAAKSASIVVDANTGKVLQSSSSEDLRYPASLTKMMTLYLIFEQIEDGALSYGTDIVASARAAAKPASKLGLKPGQRISVRTAISALIVKSANDVATAVAEHIGGSEAGFAKLMTAKARELGMPRTVFRNASGLPDSKQVTTAREMVTLALRLQDHFPNHYHNFKMTDFSYAGKRYRTHNAIVRSFPGADGLKTGYIRASGFNIVSSVRRGRKHVIAAVFGGKTASQRNRRARLLLTRALAKAATTRTRKHHKRIVRPQLVARPKPVVRDRSYEAAGLSKTGSDSREATQVSRDRRQSMSASETGRRIELARVRSEPLFEARSDAPRSITELIQLIAQPRLVEALPDGNGRQQPAGAPRRDEPRRTVREAGAFQIQVGAYLSQNEAQVRLARVQIEAGDLLAGRQGLTPTVESGSRVLYRARFAGFSATDASRTCEALRTQGIDCLVARIP